MNGRYCSPQVCLDIFDNIPYLMKHYAEDSFIHHHLVLHEPGLVIPNRTEAAGLSIIPLKAETGEVVVCSLTWWIIARAAICTTSYKVGSWISSVCWLWQSDSLLGNWNVLRGLDRYRAAVAGLSIFFLFLPHSLCLTYLPPDRHSGQAVIIRQEHTVTVGFTFGSCLSSNKASL